MPHLLHRGDFVSQTYEKRGDVYVCIETYETTLTKAQMDEIKTVQQAVKDDVLDTAPKITEADDEIAKVDAVL